MPLRDAPNLSGYSSMIVGAGLSTILNALLFVSYGAYGGATSCCDKLRARIDSDKVIAPTSPNYGPENSKYWSTSCVLTPQCIFTPTSPSDVSTALKVLVQNDCEFAIRSGGHTTNPGWAGTSSGVLISLSKLNAIQVSQDTTSVVVGAGTRWGDVYAETDKYGVTVAGGRNNFIGASGFLLGGGLSFLMHEVGFAANSVLSYEIVLANGTIANVNKNFAGDLFKALKGGSGNFGIVTAFQLQTYPVNQVYAGTLNYEPAQFDSLFPLMEAYARIGTESDPKSHIISSFANIPGSLNFASFYTFHSDPVTTPPPAIKPFTEVPTSLNTLRVQTAKEAVDELTVGTVGGLRENFHTYSVRANAALYKELFDLWQTETSKLASVSGFGSAMVFQPVSNSMIRASNERGGNVLGLEPMDDPLVIVHYLCVWLNEADDKKVYSTIEKLATASQKIARSQGKLADYIYLNYASTGQPVIKSYGPAQVDFLRKVKAKYDPHNVFKKLSPGGFKIPS